MESKININNLDYHIKERDGLFQIIPLAEDIEINEDFNLYFLSGCYQSFDVYVDYFYFVIRENKVIMMMKRDGKFGEYICGLSYGFRRRYEKERVAFGDDVLVGDLPPK